MTPFVSCMDADGDLYGILPTICYFSHSHRTFPVQILSHQIRYPSRKC